MTDTPRVFLAAYHDGLSPRYEVVPEGAMGAEPWVPEGAGVRVKALEWRDQDDPMGMCSACGSYWAFPSGAWRPSDESYRNVTGIETLEAARAACQAHHEARIRAALELTTEPEPTSGGWQPIETAPKDGTQVDVWCPELGGGYRVADAWVDHAGNWRCYFDNNVRWAHQPTHWRPLPPAPDAHDGGTPTSGAYDLICCTAEDVATGRGFTGDAAADLAMAQESLRDCLKLLGWRG